MRNKTESGRTLVEMLATLSIVGLLGWGVVRVYNGMVTRVKVQNTAKMIKTLALERQNTAMSDRVGLRTKVKGPHSDLWVENGSPGNHSKYFWVETTIKDELFCKGLKESELSGADLIEINDIINGACGDNSKLAFYFKKNTSSDENLTWVDGEGQVQKCPTGSSACDSSGNATACEEGYYLTMGECERCGEHVATCEDENMPTTCAEGYELHWGACILPPQVCTMGSDCDVCATCDTETGRCQNSCVEPTNRCYKDADCGDNDCVVCDTEEHACRYACTRVDYLESTGTQYIDTGYVPTNTTGILAKFGIVFDGYDNIVIGCRQNSGNTRFLINNDAASTSEKGIECSLNTVPAARVGQRYKIFSTDAGRIITASLNYKNNRMGVVEDVEYVNYTGVSLETITYPIFVGGLNAYGSLLYPFKGKIYEVQITEETSVVRDFIPVLAPNNRPAMFDRVEKKLYYNQGTGEFLTN